MELAESEVDRIDAVLRAAEALTAARDRQHEPMTLDENELYGLAGAIARVTAELAGITDLVSQQVGPAARRRFGRTLAGLAPGDMQDAGDGGAHPGAGNGSGVRQGGAAGQAEELVNLAAGVAADLVAAVREADIAAMRLWSVLARVAEPPPRPLRWLGGPLVSPAAAPAPAQDA
ncbi:MAG TPA: hypothetical protein VGD67_17560 [Pseudonocardiaceae bacterium]